MIDLLPPDAAFEADAVERLLAVFAGYGYERVKPPLIEHEDSLLAGSGVALAQQTFRLMDPLSHRMLALRPDMTTQVARIATERLAAKPRPLRLSYAGQVVRVRGSQLRPARQFAQAGAELIGATASEADAEVVLMAAAALEDLGLRDLTVDLGIPTLVPAVVSGLDADAETLRLLRSALDRKDSQAVLSLAQGLGDIPAKALGALVTLAGPAEDVIVAMLGLDLPAAAAVERATLAHVFSLIRTAAPALRLSVDPVERRGFEYHTGVTFALFANGVSGELGRGGRYLAGEGDHREAATGVTLYMDAVLASRPQPSPRRRVFLPQDAAPAHARRLREDGWIAVQGLERTDDADRAALALGCTHVFAGGAIRALGGGGEGEG